MTPAPTGIEALLCELEALREKAGDERVWFASANPTGPHVVLFLRALSTAFPTLAAALRSQSRALAEREETIGRLQRLLREAQSVAALKYEVTHKGSGPPSDYDPDIYQLEKVTASGWWRFVHAVREALASAPKGEP